MEDGKASTDLSMFQGFFEKHSELDLETLCRAKNFSEFTEALEGTVYGKLLSQMQEKGQTGLFDCELKLDLFYFQLLWKLRNKTLKQRRSGKSWMICFGSRLDLLNIQWICRARSFYRLSQAEIYALLIPVHYRLRADKVKLLVEAEDDAKVFCGVKGDALWKAGRASDRTNAGYSAFVESNVKPDLWQRPGTAIRILRRCWIPICTGKNWRCERSLRRWRESGTDFRQRRSWGCWQSSRN